MIEQSVLSSDCEMELKSIDSNKLSSISPTPAPFKADIGIGFSKPISKNWSFLKLCSGVSHLLTPITNFFPDFLTSLDKN